MSCVDDTNSIDLNVNLATGALEANLKISDDVNNIAEIASDGLLVAAQALTIPSGCVIPFGGTSAPDGWLLCDGSAVSRSTYANLFSIISIGFGSGDGSTTFNVPDMKGRVAVGKGTHADVDTLGDSDALPDASRSPVHTTTITETAHSHAQWPNTVYAEGAELAAGTSSPNMEYSSPHHNTATALTGITGGPVSGGPRPTDAPAYLVLNHIIKT